MNQRELLLHLVQKTLSFRPSNALHYTSELMEMCLHDKVIPRDFQDTLVEGLQGAVNPNSNYAGIKYASEAARLLLPADKQTPFHDLEQSIQSNPGHVHETYEKTLCGHAFHTYSLIITSFELFARFRSTLLALVPKAFAFAARSEFDDERRSHLFLCVLYWSIVMCAQPLDQPIDTDAVWEDVVAKDAYFDGLESVTDD
jgi:hypothetical protein